MKTIGTILAVCFTGVVFSQQPAIVNNFEGFESWAVAETGELPAYWDGFNKNVEFNGMVVGTVECVEKSSVDPYEGTFSAQLTSTSIMGGPAVPAILTVGQFVVDWNLQDGDIVGGEAYTQLPTELHGQFKYAPQGVDTGFVSVWFMENGIEVGSGRFDFTETTGGWTAFSVTIDYAAGAMPDSMNIMFSSSNGDPSSIPAGTVLEIDAIGFGSFLQLEKQSLSKMRCFPNPTTDKVTIELKESNEGTVQLIDGKGTILQETHFVDAQVTMDLVELPKGVYQVVLIDETGIFAETIIRN